MAKKGKKKKEKEEKRNSQIADDCYVYLKDLSQRIYENEERRENSIIQQASHMQSAFSFVVAAVFILIPIVVANRGVLSLEFILIAFASITLALMLSLFFATRAQRRVKRVDYPSIASIENEVIKNYKNFETEAQRSKYLVATYKNMYESYSKSNNDRVKILCVSMIIFYIALGLCLAWFIVACCLLMNGG